MARPNDFPDIIKKTQKVRNKTKTGQSFTKMKGKILDNQISMSKLMMGFFIFITSFHAAISAYLVILSAHGLISLDWISQLFYFLATITTIGIPTFILKLLPKESAK